MDFIKKKIQISIRTNKFQESKQRRNLIEENSNKIDGEKKKKRSVWKNLPCLDQKLL